MVHRSQSFSFMETQLHILFFLLLTFHFSYSQVLLPQVPQVTIFTSMGKFDQNDKPQVAAFKSWLKNGKDVIIFVDNGDECNAIVPHFPGLRCIQHYCMHDELKIPFVSCILISAEAIATTKFLMYTNADIIFSNLQPSVSILNNALPSFSDGKIIGMGQRTDLDLKEGAPFPSDIIAEAEFRGALHPDYGIDYFLYTKGSLPIATMPQFLIGNSKWDNWLLSELLIRNASSVVDITRTFRVVHVGLTEKSLTERKGYIYNEQLWKISRHSTRYIGLGRVDYSKFFTLKNVLNSKPPNMYEEVIHNANLQLHRSGFIYVLSVSGDQESMFYNWLTWAQKIKFDKFLVYALDEKAESIARKRGLMTYSSLDCYKIHKKFVEPAITVFQAHPNVSIEDQWVVRNNFFMLLVKSGFSVMSIEVDTIFLSEPIIEISSGEIFSHIEGSKNTFISSSFFGISSKAAGKGEMFLRRITKCLQSGKPSKKPGTTTPLGACMNDIYLEFKANQLDIFKLLDLGLVCDSRSFFEAHVPQSFNFLPSILHVDYPVSYPEKVNLLKSWNLFLEPNTAPAKPLVTKAIESSVAAAKSLCLTIRIFAMDQKSYMARLLNTLSAAKFDSSSQVHLEFIINKPLPDKEATAANEEIVKMVEALSWKQGKKAVVVEKENVGKQKLVLRPLTLQQPAGDASAIETMLILEEGVDLSLYFHSWAKAILVKYADHQQDGLYGLALQRQQHIPGLRKGEKHLANDYLDTRIDPKSSCYRYQLVSTNGQFFYAAHWNRFVEWVSKRAADKKFSPCVPFLTTNQQYVDSPASSPWTVYFHKYAHENGLYNLYLNYAKANNTVNVALAIDTPEHLAQISVRKGSKKNSLVLKLIDGDLNLKLLPLKYYPLFDFFFSRITDGAIAENWRFTSNFDTDSCMTNVKRPAAAKASSAYV